jgi:hypothetical protein
MGDWSGGEEEGGGVRERRERPYVVNDSLQIATVMSPLVASTTAQLTARTERG